MEKTTCKSAFEKFISVFLVLFFAIAGHQVKKAEAYETLDGYTFTITNGVAWITKYSGSLSNIIVPNEVYDGNTFIKVKGVKQGAFNYNTNMQTVKISEGIESIEWFSFIFCSNLTYVELPKSLSSISSKSFNNCMNLEQYVLDQDNPFFEQIDGVIYSENMSTLICSPPQNNLNTLVIPESVNLIQSGAFSDNNNLEHIVFPLNNVTVLDSAFSRCNSLTEIHIPANTKIEIGAFYQSSSIVSFTVDNENLYHQSQDGVLFNKDATQLIQYPASSPLEAYIFLEQTLDVAYDAFSGTKNLRVVTLPEGMVDIPDRIFTDATSIRNINLSSKTNSIDFNAFYNCTSLNSINLPNTLRRISDNAFYNCDSLESIDIPSNVQEISFGVFYDCDRLSEVYLPDSLITLGQNAFSDCDNLSLVTIGSKLSVISRSSFSGTNIKYIKIPGTVKVIDDYAFYDSGLQNMVLESGIEFIDNYAFSNNNLIDVIIPDTVKGIGNGVFSENRLLEKVKLSNMITQIPNYSFYNCLNLQKIELHEGLNRIGDVAFGGNHQLHILHIPSTVTELGANCFNASGLSEIYFYGNSPITRYNTFLFANVDTIYYKAGMGGWESGFLQGIKAMPFYQINYNSLFNSDLIQNTQTPYLPGESAMILRFPTEGNGETHYFNGWRAKDRSDDVIYPGNSVHTFTDYHLNLEAIWSEYPIYVVSFYGTDTEIIPDQYLESNDILIEPELLGKVGYTLDGWYKEAECINLWNYIDDTVIADTNLYAKWKVNSYPINFDSQGGSAVEVMTLSYNTLVTAPEEPTRTGYIFDGWYKEKDCINQWNFDVDTVTSTITLYAKWKVNTYLINFDSQGGSEVEVITVDYNTLATATETPTRTGYTFDGWYKEKDCVNLWDFDDDKVTSTITLYAKWIKDYSGIYHIRSVNSDLVMDVYDGGTTEGTNIIQWGFHGRENQQWRFESLGNGYYKITSVLNPAYSLDVYDAGTSIGNRVIQWTYHGGTNQQWKVTENADGSVSLMSRLAVESGTGYVLDVFGGGKEPGVNVIQWSGNGRDNQKWNLEAVKAYAVSYDSNGGSAVASSSVRTDALVAEPQAPTKEGMIFLGWYRNPALTAPWDFAKDRMPAEDMTLYAKWQADLSGTYVIRSVNSDLVMDVYDGGTKEGTNIIQWGYHGRENQQWRFESLGNGYYKITSVLNPTYSLDVYDAGTSIGNRVIQWTYHGGTNQQWKVTANADGSVSLMSRLAVESGTGYVLDVFGGGKEPGVNVIQWSGNGGDNQKWNLEAVN